MAFTFFLNRGIKFLELLVAAQSAALGIGGHTPFLKRFLMAPGTTLSGPHSYHCLLSASSNASSSLPDLHSLASSRHSLPCLHSMP